MPTKEEFLVKFASQTGAEIPGIGSKQADSTDIHINTDAPAPTDEAPALTASTTLTEATTETESTTQQEDEELFMALYGFQGSSKEGILTKIATGFCHVF